MKIQLVKEYDNKGRMCYYTQVDGVRITESTRYSLFEAKDAYEEEKRNFTRARTVILQEEEI